MLRNFPCIWFDGSLVSQINYTGKVETIDPYAPLKASRLKHVHIYQDGKSILINSDAVGEKQLYALLGEIEKSGKELNKKVHLASHSLGL